jgi:hypothetical protein
VRIVSGKLNGGATEAKPCTASWLHAYCLRINTQQKNMHDGIAQLSWVTFSGKTSGNSWTHASSSMQDNRSVYWYAFTTRKFPSTSHAARIKSNGRSEDEKAANEGSHPHFQPSRSINLPHPTKPSVILRSVVDHRVPQAHTDICKSCMACT